MTAERKHYRKTIGVLGGTFNPVHCGHIMLASYLAQFADVDEVWLMLSPANPLKVHDDSVTDADRCHMLQLALEPYSYLQPCFIEHEMPRPSYTINSLNRLSELYPDCRFRLIMGSDNWLIFNQWRDYEKITKHFSPIVYPRPGYDVDAGSLPQGVDYVKAPEIELSSSFIRCSIAEGKDMRAFLPEGVGKYIADHHLYV
ncbi:MAG: nicotinate (nicotinamide) nucleotide adenylyltransferase [Bacteroides sp.]|nr:nicotinate (nicotinamide) nucleotide adenylyltransferase [Bacteroides sp.]MCM1413368.1 nicotinate (nicotinamide) nucleotide adenylyltransferase [Bacteroides sp.]MCM1471946.1 nicotinate (nicotinamide) nucleotide adenylyltransferase [Bacteroides sp.]